MYLKLNDNELEVVKEISKLTMTDYELESDMLPEDSFVVMLEDLLCKYHRIEEEFKDYKEKVENSEDY